MKSPTVILAGLQPDLRLLALEAARVAFPRAQCWEVDTLAAAMAKPSASAHQLLVLAPTDENAIAAASQAVDGQGLPHWAVVVLGPAASELVEVVPPDEWNLPLLCRVFRATLLQHEMLRENLRLRGDLKTVARRINHDIRTPLGCVHTASDLLKAIGPDAASSVSEILGQSSAEIAQILTRMSLVLNASADLKIPAPVNMGRIIADVLRQLEAEFDLTVAEVNRPETWPEVTGVDAWLEAIWWNLLSNSLRHGGEKPRLQLTWTSEAEAYRFAVTDQGPGIPPDSRKTLFSPFEHLHAVQSRGLGLTVVQRLVSLQGGTCRYESPPEGGNRFSFTLPSPVQAVASA